MTRAIRVNVTRAAMAMMTALTAIAGPCIPELVFGLSCSAGDDSAALAKSVVVAVSVAIIEEVERAAMVGAENGGARRKMVFTVKEQRV